MLLIVSKSKEPCSDSTRLLLIGKMRPRLFSDEPAIQEDYYGNHNEHEYPVNCNLLNYNYFHSFNVLKGE